MASGLRRNDKESKWGNSNWNKEKGRNFIDLVVKQKNFVPSHKYDTMTEWKGEKFMPRRGKWGKSNRRTFTSQVMETQKKLEIPAPGQWDGCNKSLISAKGEKMKCDRAERNLKNIADAI